MLSLLPLLWIPEHWEQLVAAQLTTTSRNNNVSSVVVFQPAVCRGPLEPLDAESNRKKQKTSPGSCPECLSHLSLSLTFLNNGLIWAKSILTNFPDRICEIHGGHSLYISLCIFGINQVGFKSYPVHVSYGVSQRDSLSDSLAIL